MMENRRIVSLSPNLNVMSNAAFRAARGLVKDFGEVEHLQVSRKGPGDFVTNADKFAERNIHKELSKARPEHGFLMEESGEIPGTSGFRWIVDPLDGTSNFMHGIPHFAISIALEKEGGEIIAGLIYDPVKDEMFMAEKGYGAFLNDRRIRVSSRKDMSHALLGTGIPFASNSKSDMEYCQSTLTELMPQVAGIRRMGAASLDMAYVAAGRFEGYWESPIESWDVAAGIIIVKEAGGFVTDLKGSDDMLKKKEILASNGVLHRHILKAVKK